MEWKGVNMRAFVLFFISFFMFIGCASTGVIPLGQNTYMIGQKDGTPGLGVSFTVKAEIYKEAVTFCAQQNKDVKTLEVITIPSAPARLGSTEIRFTCIEKGTIGESYPTQIIENRNR